MSLSLRQLLPERQLPETVAELIVTGLCHDSRKVSKGDLFVALSGHQLEGRTFIDNAERAGAVAALLDSDTDELLLESSMPVIGVQELRQQLGEIAARFYGQPAQFLQVIGVTGTNGKTSTASFIRDALGALDQPTALMGTLGVQFESNHEASLHTTPEPLVLHETLARLRCAGARSLVMEVSSHAMEQHRLTAIPVSVAVFTNLSHDHLDYHGSMDAYFAAKARLFRHPGLSVAVINLDDEAGLKLRGEIASSIRVLGYGQHADAIVSCKSLKLTEEGIALQIVVQGRDIHCVLPLYGRFNVDNVLAVATTLLALEYDVTCIQRALAVIRPVAGRMEPVTLSETLRSETVGSKTLGGVASDIRVVVDYAHTPDALEKSLVALRQHFTGNLWCVFGCGGNRDSAKRPRMGKIAETLADHVILTSDNPRNENPDHIIDEIYHGIGNPANISRISDRPAAINTAIEQAAAGDVVLIAGKGHESWQEIAGKKIAMDDRLLVRDALLARMPSRRGEVRS